MSGDPSEERTDEWFEEAFDDEDAEDGDEDDGYEEAFGTDGDAFDDDEDAFDADRDPFDEAGGTGAFERPGEGGLFEEDFASAFGGGSGGGSESFDEELDSDIPRLDIGIEGLDEMIHGGVPQRSLMVVMGSAGTGKTTFGLQFINEALENGENAIFITLEESKTDILDAAEEKGWSFERYVEEERLALVDLDPIEMANSLSSIGGDLPRLVEAFDASRLVLDSVSLLEMMYDSQADRRMEIFDFTRRLKDAGVTIMVTSEAAESNPYVSRHGIVEYLTDAVFVLQYVRSEFKETRLAVEIQKIRNANHSRETKPYEITADGISVYQKANIF